MIVQVVRQGTTSRVVSQSEVVRAAEAMLRCLGLSRAELSVMLCGDGEIHALNRDYRKRDRPTDVLAFAMREGEAGERAGDVLGDVVIAVPTATRQARERGVPARAEITMLLAHGILHLLGWDHATEPDDRRMRAEVDRLVAVVTRAEARRGKRLTRTVPQRTVRTPRSRG